MLIIDELRIAGLIKNCITFLLLFSKHKGLPSWTTYSCMHSLSDVKMLEPSCRLKITHSYSFWSSPSLQPLSSYLSPSSFLDFPSFCFSLFSTSYSCFLHPFIYPRHVSLFSFPPLPPVRSSINLGVNHFTTRRRSGRGEGREGRGGGENWYHSKLYKNVKEKQLDLWTKSYNLEPNFRAQGLLKNQLANVSIVFPFL